MLPTDYRAGSVKVSALRGQPKRGTVSKHEDTMSKHDTATKRHRRPKSAKRVDYTARTMAALKELEKAAKLRTKPA
jgi:hypothetical protein